MLYNKPSQYALRALSYIVQNSSDKPCRAELISKEEHIPRPFLSKILKQLERAKILISIKGPGGGFKIGCDPKALTLYEILNIFEDMEGFFSECAIGWATCSDEKPCALHYPYKEVKKGIKCYFNSTTLDVFIKASSWKKKHTT